MHSSFTLNGFQDHNSKVYGHENQISPPDDRITQQVNLLVFNTGTKKLTLKKVKKYCLNISEFISKHTIKKDKLLSFFIIFVHGYNDNVSI